MTRISSDITAYDDYCDRAIEPPRSLQSLLAYRRCLVMEMRHESDATARAMLQFAIDEVDEEIRGRL